MPILDIDCGWSDNEDKMTADALAQAKAMLEAAGIRVTYAFDNHQPPGLAIHEMGTARMGRDPKTSVLNKWNQIHAVKKRLRDGRGQHGVVGLPEPFADVHGPDRTGCRLRREGNEEKEFVSSDKYECWPETARDPIF